MARTTKTPKWYREIQERQYPVVIVVVDTPRLAELARQFERVWRAMSTVGITASEAVRQMSEFGRVYNNGRHAHLARQIEHGMGVPHTKIIFPRAELHRREGGAN